MIYYAISDSMSYTTYVTEFKTMAEAAIFDAVTSGASSMDLISKNNTGMPPGTFLWSHEITGAAVCASMNDDINIVIDNSRYGLRKFLGLDRDVKFKLVGSNE